MHMGLNPRKTILTFAILLAFASISASQNAPTMGAIVAKTDYDRDNRVTTLRILNTSQKEITAFSLDMVVEYPDGTLSDSGTSGWGCEMVDAIAEGVGGIQPGASFDQEFPGYPGPIKATVIMVVYSDGTADVQDDRLLQEIVGGRKGTLLAMRKANEIMTAALNDAADLHPSAMALAQVKALITPAALEKLPPDTALGFKSELADTILNLSHMHSTPTGPSANEINAMEALIETNTRRIPVFNQQSVLAATAPR
jgi:hypothetical protein